MTVKGNMLRWRHGPLRATAPLYAWEGVLAARGLCESDAFFSPRLGDLPDPDDMRDMAVAADRLARAIGEKERIHVFGDFDCDGVSGTAILVEALSAAGVDVSFSIPHRADDGHGIGAAAVREAAHLGCTLGISVDTGTTCFAACAEARSCGFDLIVTDHHLPEASLPDAFAVLNPARVDCGFADRALCGTGVAFFLLMSVWRRLKAQGASPALDLRRLLDRVAIATVADVMSLTGVNRILVYHGLRQMQQRPAAGVAALMQAGRVKGAVTVQDIAFQLAPRINAAGRMQHGEQAMRLLMARDRAEAEGLAADLDECNRLRQRVERDILKKVEAHLADTPDDALAAYDPEWHAGVVGLVAGQLARKHGCPAAIGFVESSGMIRVSLRGAPGFHVGEVLQACSEYMEHFGGHRGAGGGSIRPENWEGFRQAFRRASVRPEGRAGAVIEIDGVLAPSAVHTGLVERLARFEPCGKGNPECVWLLEGGQVVNRQDLRAGAIRLRYAAAEGQVDAIAFRASALDATLRPGSRAGLVGRLCFDRFRGHGAVQFIIDDVVACDSSA